MDREELLRKIRTSGERHKITVPEWDVVLFTKHYTPADRAFALSLAEAKDEKSAIKILVRKLEFEDGSKPFTEDDVDVLFEEGDEVVLSRLMVWLAETTYASPEEAEADLGKDPTSTSGSKSPADSDGS